MPYASISELPKSVRDNLPKEKQQQFREVFNSVYADTKSDERAMRAAWSVVNKMKIASDVFTTQPEAMARSMDLGLGGATHVYDYAGQAYYMPGESHEAYLEFYSGEMKEEEEPSYDMLECAIETIIETVMEAMYKADVKVGDRVSWQSSGGTARGIVRSIHREGNVPNIPVKITATEEEPAARIELVDEDGEPRGEFVGHKITTLRKFVEKAEYQGEKVTLNKPFRLPSGSGKKFGVYVKDGDKVKRVTFGDPNMEIRRDDPDARRNFRARHNCDTATDKTSARYWSCRMWEEGVSVSEMTKADISGEILKFDDEQRLVYGWASVVTKNGEPVVDRQGDVIEPETLVKAVNTFMEHVRVGKQMHNGDQIGMVVHSWPMTNEISKAVGIQSDREGWLVAFKVYDDNVWAKVKSGELAAFSIGGRAIKEDYNG